jgi:hypothetical protein
MLLGLLCQGSCLLNAKIGQRNVGKAADTVFNVPGGLPVAGNEKGHDGIPPV